MNLKWQRNLSVIAGCWLALGLAALGEGIGLSAQMKALKLARKAAAQGARELRSLHAVVPAPTAETNHAVEADLEAAKEVLAELQEAAAPGSPIMERFAGAAVPAHRPEAFFDLAAFIDAMRLRARQAGVVVRPDECFGFAAYAHEAPESEIIPAVFRERQQVQYLVETLLAARPAEFLGVQRESLPLAAERGDRTASRTARPIVVAGKTAADELNVPRALTLRAAGSIEAKAYRLTFTGRTEVLRTWLNRLAEFELPVVVRAVEAGPAKVPAEVRGRAGREAGPLVASAPTRFSVTVEFVAATSAPAA
jgi:hypothetical protein